MVERLCGTYTTLIRVLGFVTCLALVACTPHDGAVSKQTIALNDSGVSKMGQFQYSSAFEDFSQVVKDAPYWDEGVVNLAIATLNRQDIGDEKLALETLEIVLSRNPTNVRALYTSGIINLYLGETQPAVEFLEQAIALDPADAFATYFLGQAYLQAERYEEAQSWLLKTLELNPAMRSAYWAASTASRRLGQDERALALIDDYQSFEHNPLSVSAGFSYKQMGPKAEAKSVQSNVTPANAKPEGSLFKDSLVILEGSKPVTSVASYDLNGDESWDLVVSNGESTTVLAGSESGYEVKSIAGLERGFRAVAFGDLENDGQTELIRCIEDYVEVLGQESDSWEVTLQLPAQNCDGIRIVDADHDGDLDVLAYGRSGIHLHYNNLDGSFNLLSDSNLDLNSPVRQVLIADIDRDRDADVLLIGQATPNRYWQNELTRHYKPTDDTGEFANRQIVAATAVDIDQDGLLEIITATTASELEIWEPVSRGWVSLPLDVEHSSTISQLDSKDFDGDGRQDLLIVHESGFQVVDIASQTILATHTVNELTFGASVYTHPGTGPELITASDAGVLHWPAGTRRHAFLAIAPTGKSSADQMRSNASGIGTYVRLRADTRWSLASNHSTHSGASQSLQPMMFGSGGALKANYIELLWSDGVTQTESDLAFNQLHSVEEVQRQLASCPVVFVWNGEKYEFLSDVLGVAALGYFYKPGLQTPVRPYERILLPKDMLQPRNGKFEVKIGEPMEEVLYLDSANLLFYDVPEGWQLALDERLSVNGPQPTGSPIYFQKEWLPVSASSNRSQDAFVKLRQADRIAVDPGPVDRRFIGLLEAEHQLTLEFGESLPNQSAVLVAEGWVEFPYSQTSYSAYQSDVAFKAPTLEVRDRNGKWQTIAKEFGYPAGMPRQMALPLPDLPEGSDALRLTSNLEIYWDHIKVVQSEDPIQGSDGKAELEGATVKVTGFALRTTGDQRVPYYDYEKRTTYWDSKLATGFYTTTGDSLPLVERLDSAVAIVGSGEEVHLQFSVPSDPPEGFVRRYVVEFRGWAKDMDLYTTSGDQVEPIPQLGDLDTMATAKRDSLHARYNIRFQSGLPVR